MACGNPNCGLCKTRRQEEDKEDDSSIIHDESSDGGGDTVENAIRKAVGMTREIASKSSSMSSSAKKALTKATGIAERAVSAIGKDDDDKSGDSDDSENTRNNKQMSRFFAQMLGMIDNDSSSSSSSSSSGGGGSSDEDDEVKAAVKAAKVAAKQARRDRIAAENQALKETLLATRAAVVPGNPSETTNKDWMYNSILKEVTKNMTTTSLGMYTSGLIPGTFEKDDERLGIFGLTKEVIVSWPARIQADIPGAQSCVIGNKTVGYRMVVLWTSESTDANKLDELIDGLIKSMTQ